MSTLAHRGGPKEGGRGSTLSDRPCDGHTTTRIGEVLHAQAAMHEAADNHRTTVRAQRASRLSASPSRATCCGLEHRTATASVASHTECTERRATITRNGPPGSASSCEQRARALQRVCALRARRSIAQQRTRSDTARRAPCRAACREYPGGPGTTSACGVLAWFYVCLVGGRVEQSQVHL